MLECPKCKRNFESKIALGAHSVVCGKKIKKEKVNREEKFKYHIENYDTFLFYLLNESKLKIHFFNLSNEIFLKSIYNRVKGQHTSIKKIDNLVISFFNRNILNKQFWIDRGWNNIKQIEKFISDRQKKIHKEENSFFKNQKVPFFNDKDVNFFINYEKIEYTIKAKSLSELTSKTRNVVYHLQKDSNKKLLDELYNLTTELNSDNLEERYIFYLRKKHISDLICPYCDNKRSFSYKLKDWNETCGSQKCSQKQIEKTNLQKYGHKNAALSVEISDKIHQTNLKKYGTPYAISSKIVRKKIKETTIERYGLDHHFKNKEIQEKRKKSFLKGVLDTKMLERFNNYNLIYLDYQDQHYILHCNDCCKDVKIYYELLSDRYRKNMKMCTSCNPIKKLYSLAEMDISNFIRNLGINVLNNFRLKKKELDIYLPDYNIGFEYNGIYWHSEKFKDKNHLLEKKKFFQEESIRLYHIWEDDWIFKKEIIQSRILNIVGKSKKIYARKCKIKTVSKKEEKTFLLKNHIQGYVNSKIAYGLYFEDELVSIMTFSNLRTNLGQKHKEGHYELLRFCNSLNVSVVGGASKLIEHFKKNNEYKEVISYADLCWSNGNLYKQLGFELSSISKPNYYYVIHEKRLNRFKFRKDVLVKQGFDPNKSEKEIMSDRGYFRLYDCGAQKWTLKNKS